MHSEARSVARCILANVGHAVLELEMVGSLNRLSDRARKVIMLSREEAELLSHRVAGPEHLLLGLAREGDGVAARVLSILGLDLPRLRTSVRSIARSSEGTITSEIGLTPQAIEVIELAVVEAQRLHQYYAGTEHIVLGLVRSGESTVSDVLSDLGVSLDQLHDEVMRVLDQTGIYAGIYLRPLLRQLVRVIPASQSRIEGNIEVTLLALELYQEGFVTTFRALAADPWPGVSFMSQTGIKASDDQGGQYVGDVDVTRWDPIQWRLTAAFSPAPRPTAQELDLELAVLNTEPAGKGWASATYLWRFSVALRAN